jgi:dTDP-4-dehydrorhamnose reductase
VQAALDAGASMKVNTAAIQPILAVEYPLPAPRPMNSRMSTDKLHQVFAERGDVSELQHLNQPWDGAVKAYVARLARDGHI